MDSSAVPTTAVPSMGASAAGTRFARMWSAVHRRPRRLRCPQSWFLALGLAGLAVVVCGLWWAVTERMPRRGFGITGGVVGVTLIVLAIIWVTPMPIGHSSVLRFWPCCWPVRWLRKGSARA